MPWRLVDWFVKCTDFFLLNEKPGTFIAIIFSLAILMRYLRHYTNKKDALQSEKDVPHHPVFPQSSHFHNT